MSSRRRVPSALTVVLTLLVGCGDDGTPPDEVSIDLTPATSSLFVGETVQLSAEVTGASGATVTYGATPSGIVTVSGSGLVSAVGLGTATVTATVQGEGASATAQVTVEPSSVAVTPGEAEVQVGETVQLTATITGGVGLTTSWSSEDEGVATVDQTGLVTGVGPGEVEVTAEIDGQPGVSDAAAVTVTEAPPEVLEARILDADGDEADLGNVVDVLRFEFDIEGSPGTGGQIDILFDGEVVHTEEFTIEAPLAGGPLRAVTHSVSAEVNASPISVIDDELIQNHLGATTVQAVLESLGGREVVRLRGQEQLQATLKPSNKIFIRGVRNLGEVRTFDGIEVTPGAQEVDLQLLPVADIARVEILMDGASTVYGSDVVSGVVNVIIDEGDRPGYEGENRITSVTGYDAADLSVPLNIGDPRFIVSGSLGPFTQFDGASPTFQGVVEVPQILNPLGIFPDGGIGDATGTDPYPYSDLSGYAASVEYTLNGTDWLAVNSSADLADFDGGVVNLRTCAEDFWGHRFCTKFTGPSGPADFGIDQTAGGFEIRTGSQYIKPYQKGVRLDQVVSYAYNDLPGAFGSYASGHTGEPVEGWVRRDWSGGTEFVWGSEDEPAPLDGFLDPTGYAGDFETWGAGEYTIYGETTDRAFNPTSTSLRLTASYTDPVVSGFEVSGSFEPWGTIVYDFDASDPLELLAVAGGVAFDDAWDGERLHYIGRFEHVGERFDGSFTNEYTAEGWEYSGYPQHVETVSPTPPHGPTGQRFQATFGFGAALNAAGRTGIATYPFTDLEGPGLGYGVGGTDAFSNLGGPSTLDATDTGTYSLEAFSTGDVSIGLAQLALTVRLGGQLLAVPVSEPVEGTVENFGSFTRKFWQANFSPVDVGVLGEVQIIWIGFPVDFDERNSVLLSRGSELDIRKDP